MDVAVEVMDGTEPVKRLVNQIHGVIRTDEDAGT